MIKTGNHSRQTWVIPSTYIDSQLHVHDVSLDFTKNKPFCSIILQTFLYKGSNNMSLSNTIPRYENLETNIICLLPALTTEFNLPLLATIIHFVLSTFNWRQ